MSDGVVYIVGAQVTMLVAQSIFSVQNQVKYLFNYKTD